MKMFSFDGIYYNDSVQTFVFLTIYLKKWNYLSCRAMLLKVSDKGTVLDFHQSQTDAQSYCIELLNTLSACNLPRAFKNT